MCELVINQGLHWGTALIKDAIIKMKSESSCYPFLQLKCRKKTLNKNKPFLKFSSYNEQYVTTSNSVLMASKLQHLNSPSSVISNRIYKVVLFKGSGHGNKKAILAYSTSDLLQGSRIKTSAPELPPPPFCVSTVRLYVRSDNVIKTSSDPKKMLLKECLMLFLMKYYSPLFMAFICLLDLSRDILNSAPLEKLLWCNTLKNANLSTPAGLKSSEGKFLFPFR